VEKDNVVLRSYKMATDRGFAPNPFEGFLTLATCKPGIRRCHKKDHWLAGFTSKTLNRDKVGQEKLIYLAKIDEIFPLEAYYEKYPQKRTCPSADNIYVKQNGKWKLVNDDIHNEKRDMRKDLSGENVLVAKHYYYFGKEALDIQDVREKINIPHGQSSYGCLTKDKAAADFIEWVKNKAKELAQKEMGKKLLQVGMLGEPHGQVIPRKDDTFNASFELSCRRSFKKGCS